MVRIIKLAFTLLTLLTFTRLEAADLSSLNGVWNGVWHIGMSSGKAVLRIEPSGDATIRFTNLEGFNDTVLGPVAGRVDAALGDRDPREPALRLCQAVTASHTATMAGLLAERIKTRLPGFTP